MVYIIAAVIGSFIGYWLWDQYDRYRGRQYQRMTPEQKQAFWEKVLGGK